MFCPQCSQEQISEDTRFCSRCGFLMTGVSQLTCQQRNAAAIAAFIRFRFGNTAQKRSQKRR